MDILSYTLETAQQFWDELREIISVEYHSPDTIEQTLSVFLRFAAMYMNQYLESDQDLLRCCRELMASNVYSRNRAYVRRRLISRLKTCSGLSQAPALHNAVPGRPRSNSGDRVIAVPRRRSVSFKRRPGGVNGNGNGNRMRSCSNSGSGPDTVDATRILVGLVLLLDGKQHQSTMEMMQEEACSCIVVDIIMSNRNHGDMPNPRLDHIYLELLYEMCRVQKLPVADLKRINSEFVSHLFTLVDSGPLITSASDPTPHLSHALSAMKVVLALNEQFMVAAASPHPTANLVLETLRAQAPSVPTFGQGLVLLVNRCVDSCLQMMSMKMLYGIFTDPALYHYIYLNDLRVLTQVLLRELTDLPGDAEQMRHTYLRVLHPLLENTEIGLDRYMRDEIEAVLLSMAPGDNDRPYRSAYTYDDTTQRLAERCLGVSWLNHALPALTPSSTASSGDTIKRPVPPVPMPRKLYKDSRNNSAMDLAQSN